MRNVIIFSGSEKLDVCEGGGEVVYVVFEISAKGKREETRGKMVNGVIEVETESKVCKGGGMVIHLGDKKKKECQF